MKQYYAMIAAAGALWGLLSLFLRCFRLRD